MKRALMFTGAMVALLSFNSAHAQVQKGYWVVEGNVNQPDFTIIHFYNSRHEKIGEEKVQGEWLDITKKRNAKLLNRKLRRVEEGNSLTSRERKGRKNVAKV